jgi:hypothetical protein
MKVNPQTDELLSAFLDGELSPRQQTEVQRMAAHDPDMARRLEQLRGCRTLINMLPRADAPADLLEQVKASLERRSLLEEHSILTSTSAGVRTLKIRRFLAAAAMIALVGILGVVVYQIVIPVPSARPSNWAATPVDTGATSAPMLRRAANASFSGRLELSTLSLSQAEGVISKSMFDKGLVGVIEKDPSGTRAVCHIAGSREALDGLLADLNAAGQTFQTARLFVETDRFDDPIVVDSVTFPQVAGILNQNSEKARVQAAKDTAVLNQFAQEMPGREVQVATSQKLDHAAAELSASPRPWLAEPERKYPSGSTPLVEEETKVKASITIVLLHAQ